MRLPQPWQRMLVLATAVAVALSRLLAVSRSLWDWDEALFCLALGDYDVVVHRPHPPGFPVYVALAKVAALVLPAFRSYQFINGLAACALFPLLYLLGRELRFPFAAAFGGALLYVFLPNVWYFGGTAFSDVTGTAMIVASCLLLLIGRRSAAAFAFGAIVLGLAAGIRPQALLFAAVPALMATWAQWKVSRARVVAVVAMGGAVVAICYGGAALASSSVSGYLHTSAALKDYLRKVDSFLAPGRPPLTSLIGTYFVDPMRSGKLGLLMTGLASIAAVAALVRRDRGVVVLLSIFAPFVIFAWLMLDLNSVTRYSIAWLPLYAMLAAHAPFAVLPLRSSRVATLASTLIVAVLLFRSVTWTLPALREVREHVSPTVRAMTWMLEHGGSGTLYVDGALMPMAALYLPPERTVIVSAENDIPLDAIAPGSQFAVEGIVPSPEHTFVRDRGRLFEIARRRYFEVSIVHVDEFPHFIAGWYGAEGEGAREWRWMSGRSVTMLPSRSGPALLRLELEPANAAAKIDVVLNGAVLERFSCPTRCVKQWQVASRRNGNELTISTDRVVNPERAGHPGDSRNLGLRVWQVDWTAPGAKR
jgi:hypothetical protein